MKEITKAEELEMVSVSTKRFSRYYSLRFTPQAFCATKIIGSRASS